MNVIEEKGLVDQVPEGPMEGCETNKDRNTDRWHDGWRDEIDDPQEDHR